MRKGSPLPIRLSCRARSALSGARAFYSAADAWGLRTRGSRAAFERSRSVIVPIALGFSRRHRVARAHRALLLSISNVASGRGSTAAAPRRPFLSTPSSHDGRITSCSQWNIAVFRVTFRSADDSAPPERDRASRASVCVPKLVVSRLFPISRGSPGPAFYAGIVQRGTNNRAAEEGGIV
jgi:hypothetical protein